MTAGARMMTGREAAAALSEMGPTPAISLPRETARRALLTGIAGPGLRRRGALLYDEESVLALLQPPLTEEDLPEAMRSGTFVARVSAPGTPRGFSLSASPEDQREAVRSKWRISLETRLVMWARAQRDWPMPFVAAVSGIAVLGANIIATKGPMSRPARTSTQLTLVEPGTWYDAIHLRRLPMPLGSSGGPWTMIPDGTLLSPGFGPGSSQSRQTQTRLRAQSHPCHGVFWNGDHSTPTLEA